jgi:hypothetical protein
MEGDRLSSTVFTLMSLDARNLVRMSLRLLAEIAGGDGDGDGFVRGAEGEG